MTDQVRVFVSHSHQDNEYCREYVAGLRARGCRVWYDEHNLGWGELRASIQSELERSQHFVAILSPASVASQWVNREIDAAIQLSDRGQLKSIIFAVAKRCTVPLLLSSWKRIEGPGGAPYRVGDAVAKTLNIIGVPLLPPNSPSSSPVVAPKAQPVPPSEKPKPKPAPVHPSASHGISRRTVLTGAGAGVGAAIIGGIVLVTRQSLGGLANATPTPTSTLPASTSTPVTLPSGLVSLGFTLKSSGSAKYIVPPLCDVPAGDFLMGSNPARDSQAQGNEKPESKLKLGVYQIGKHPVTVAEYAHFVASGHSAPSFDWEWQQTRPDHPMVSVSWKDAKAYTDWLARLTGEPWRLVSEAEWEKAARGTDGRIYPWGDVFDVTRCNTYESNKGSTTPVGSYPSGASPCGAQDMAGNVWEWLNTLYEPYPYNNSDGRENPDSTEDRVCRGGSFAALAEAARAAYRISSQYDFVNISQVSAYGFRLARSVPS